METKKELWTAEMPIVMATVSDQGPTVMSSWDVAAEKALVRKIDLHIFPVMIVLFVLNFIDRNNFANARLRGLEADLHLSDVQYQTCISILLVGYVVMQVPSNLVLNAITRPSTYLCACVAVWGVISAATAAVHSATGAILCRFFLGCVEASFFPGSLYFLSRWYTRQEMQLRVTVLNAGNLAAQAFGGLIATGILTDMDGDRGLRAWRWLFLNKRGSLTVALAAMAVFVLPDYPNSTRWLSAEEKHMASGRLALDSGLTLDGNMDDDVTGFQGLLLAVKDPKVWLLGITYHATIMGLSFAFFFPTITQALGYNTTDTLLLTAPPWIWAMLVSLPNAWHADRSGERFLHYFGPALACIVGYIISATTTTVAPRYFSMFLMTTGFASGFIMLAWISNTIPYPRAKKAAAIAMVNAMGNIGSIPGSYIWPAKYGPLYVKSFGAMIAILGFGCVCALFLRFYLIAQNKKLDRAENMAMTASGDDREKAVSTVVRMDKSFRYLY
ncbi:major facilitator superfamily transporter [Grosmannia clavigera kw1407]|uniref:Major facilitator superfamily transporter n=1 Tax=Grosmannia clavigera (strain kw1407 / UAMH 11150) TaxID=655863 RepID=F0XQT8_GROCL|nr:major facilitator superfamily transporter [Grosmannia clavigera kw1407]EFW99834.1 major facilitator superfamily transporter [Grosmannia clavigera kw1407]